MLNAHHIVHPLYSWYQLAGNPQFLPSYSTKNMQSEFKSYFMEIVEVCFRQCQFKRLTSQPSPSARLGLEKYPEPQTFIAHLFS